MRKKCDQLQRDNRTYECTNYLYCQKSHDNDGNFICSPANVPVNLAFVLIFALIFVIVVILSVLHCVVCEDKKLC